MPLEVLRPDWGAPPQVSALASTRQGGVSRPPFDSLNLGRLADGADAGDALAENRRRFAAALGARPVWLRQVHGAAVVTLDAHAAQAAPEADAAVTTQPGLACTVLVADCLPVLFCVDGGRAVGAAHAGWRGLSAGVLEQTVSSLCRLARCAPAEVSAWLGPCIGPRRFEVGTDVVEAFGESPADADPLVFRPRGGTGGSPRWLADLPELARRRLRGAGLHCISGGIWCTVEDAARFFSYRRDGRTGRMAAAVCIREPAAHP